MHVAGFHVERRSASEDEGKQDVVMFLARGHQFAEYFAPAEITDSTFKAKLRLARRTRLQLRAEGLGREPNASASPGQPRRTFTGTFDFTGEKGYVHIDAPASPGLYSPRPGTVRRARLRPPAERLRRPRAVPYQPYVGRRRDADGGDDREDDER